MRRAILAAIVVAGLLSIGSCKKGMGARESPTSPSGSGGAAPAAGAWTGTIIRPGRLETLSVRWEVTTSVDGLFGPMTLTRGGASVTVQVHGLTGGNDRQGYNIHLQFTSNAGDSPAFPSCFVRGNSVSQSGDPFPPPYTSITTSAFDISYSGCRGFIDSGYSSPQSNRVQLNLGK